MKKIFQKYGLYIGLGTLTIVLMIIFKQQGSIVESGTNSLLDFYSQNLRPLFAETNLTREDVINFAFNKNLPLNREKNRIVELSEDYNNNDVIEVKSAVINENAGNYDRFVKYLKLNENERDRLDSLLDSYKAELNTYLFVSDNHTLAVDPKISVLRDLIMDDLLRFARNVKAEKPARRSGNKNEFIRISPSQKALHLRDYLSNSKKRDFVFVTNDTTFNASCEIETGRIKRRVSNKGWKSDLAHNESMKQYVVAPAKPFRNSLQLPGVSVDIDAPNTLARITIAGDSIPGIDAKIIREFKEQFEDIRRQFTAFAFGTSDGDENEAMILKIKDFENDSEGLNILLNWSNLQNVITTSISAGLSGKENWEAFGLKIDSLASGIITIPKDSLVIINNKSEHRKKASGAQRKKNNPKPDL